MPTSLFEAKSLLAIDIGTVNTRAAYFDVVEGRYRFIGLGLSPTTSHDPVSNVIVGMQLAIDNLQTMLGKSLMDSEGKLIIPSKSDGTGADSMVTTLSLGPAIKTIVVGLLTDVSIKSIENLAHTAYIRVVDTINLNDPRNHEQQVDAIVRYSPELMLIAGGVDGGASHSIQKILEVIGLGIYLLPQSRRPMVLFAGNKKLAQGVQNSLNNIASFVQVSPNIRPSLDVEDLAPAQRDLAGMVVNIRQTQMPELSEIRTLSGGVVLPSSYTQGRMVRFLSGYFGSGKGVLSVDVGASSISMGASFNGDLHMNVFPQLGLGEALSGLLKNTTLDDIIRWLHLDISADSVRNYLYQKSIYPGVIPFTEEELAVEQAVVRHNLQIAARVMLQRLRGQFRPRNGLMPSFEPILAGGAAITGAANPGQSLLMLIDGLQPTGITTLAIDQNNLLAMLGAIAETNSVLPVQVIDSGAFSYLATVISPVSSASYDSPILNVKMIRDDGSELVIEVLMGSMQVLPLGNRQTARLQLRPLPQVDVGAGPGRALEVEVTGSSLGIVIDARGRPIQHPTDASLRRDLAQKWLYTLGG